MKISLFSIRYIIVILLLLPSLVSVSQVTIGSGHAPVEGAILDIKSQLPDANNITSNGGILISRVKLTDLNTLEPFLNPSASDYAANKKLHTGLVVYNINVDTPKNLEMGIYQWDGTKWILLNTNQNIASPWYEVGTNTPATDNQKDAYLNAKVVVNGSSINKINNGEDAILTVTGGDASINGLTVGKGKGGLDGNTAVGEQALRLTSTSKDNTAIGHHSSLNLTSGSNNTTIGYMAGSNLTTGSHNIAIGSNTSFFRAAGDRQLNIGNAIYGTVGTGTSSTGVGRISIGEPDNTVATSNLHVKGDMILRDVKIINDAEALLIDTDGNMGVGALLPTPTPHTFYQSENSHAITVASFNNNTGYTIPWANADKLSDNMASLQNDIFTFNDSYTCLVSGYIGFQFLKVNGDHPAKTFNQMVSSDTGLGVALLEIQYSPTSNGSWSTIASGYQIWYGAAIIETVKIIQVPPTVVTIANGSRLRMVLKRPGSLGITTESITNGNHITKPAGAKYCKGLTVVALK